MGAISGIAYIVFMSTLIPILIYLDPDYSTSLSEFDPLSKLSETDFSKNYYRFLHITAGLLALIYFELRFFVNRTIYHKLNNWNLIVLSGRIGAFGQIATGLIPRGLHPWHLFAAMAFATGYVGCLVFLCFNLDNQLRLKGLFSRIINPGYVISMIALMNALYFRYSGIRGIWQFFVMITAMSWFLFEALVYRKEKNVTNENIKDNSEVLKINNISYLMIGFGIYLIIFGFLLFIKPKMWPWQCNSVNNTETCDPSNVISLLIAGVILVSYSLYYQYKVRQKIIT